MISRDLTARGSWLLAMTLLLLAGCGFHLRGQIEIADSIQPVAITAAAGSPVAAELARRLRSSGIALVSPGGGERSLLRISNERRERRDLAVGLGGRQREVELTLLVDFDLVTVDGVAVVEQQQLVMRRDYLFDESALLGKQEEEGRLEAEMAADAVRQILYRLRQVR